MCIRSSNMSAVKVCSYCRIQGHHINKCPTVKCTKCRALGHPHWLCSAEEPPKCSRCQRLGHTAEVCHTRICTLCNAQGHLAEACFGRLCTRCERRGHDSGDCKAKKWCLWCKEEHFVWLCPDRKNHVCETCGEKGHLARGCKHPSISHIDTRPSYINHDTDKYITIGHI